MAGKGDSSLAQSTVSAAKGFLVLQRRAGGTVPRCAQPQPSLAQLKPCDGSPWVSQHSVLHPESSGGGSGRRWALVGPRWQFLSGKKQVCVGIRPLK